MAVYSQTISAFDALTNAPSGSGADQFAIYRSGQAYRMSISTLQNIAGFGSVDKTGTPADTYMSIWLNSTTIQGNGLALFDDADTMMTLGGGGNTVSTDVILSLNRDVEGAENGHAISDDSYILHATSATGYNSYDARVNVNNAMNHYSGYQSRSIFNFSGNIDRIVSFQALPTINTAGVTAKIVTGFAAREIVGSSGTINKQVGFLVERQTRGDTIASIMIGGNHLGHLADFDYNIFKVNVTGLPSFDWDESEDAFVFDKELQINGVEVAKELLVFNTQTGTTYTLVLSDVSKSITMNNAAASTLTIPLNASVAFDIGTVINIHCLGAGQTTIVLTGGVTAVSIDSNLAITVNGDATLIKYGTDSWKIAGSLE